MCVILPGTIRYGGIRRLAHAIMASMLSGAFQFILTHETWKRSSSVSDHYAEQPKEPV
jgi:hypothetical protein